MATQVRKQEIVSELQGLFNNGQVAIVTNLSGFTVTELTDFRRQLAKQNSKCRVAKNTLLKIATKDGPFESMKEIFMGPTAVVIGYNDDVTGTAKATVKFIADLKKGEIRGGLVEGKLITPGEVKDLADLPSREVLLSSIMGSVDSGARNIAGMLEAVIRDLALCIEAVAEKNQAA